jgi:hypothetical protein
MSDIRVEMCRFLNDAPFAYSTTYDEGTVDCFANAYPVHKALGIPGHVNVVAGQLGQVRNCFGSSLNGYMHMSVEELRYLIERGWGIGNHSWSHFVHPIQPGLDMWRELVWSKYRLEEDLDRPIRIFALCSDFYNYDPMIELVKQHHLACVTNHILSPNRDGFDVYGIGNFRLSSGPFPPRPSWPEKLKTENIDLEAVEGAWLLDTTHLCMWDVPQARKCVTPADLTRRLEKMLEISNEKVWAAIPDDIIDYVLLRRALGVDLLESSPGRVRFQFTGEWPVGIVHSLLTLRVTGVGRPVNPSVTVESDTLPGANQRREIGEIRTQGDDLLVTMDAVPGRITEIKL